MIVDKAGEVIADILTISPSLAKIPSASAILDTSNFTFQAISYGKDASAFNHHAHLRLPFYEGDEYPSGIFLRSYQVYDSVSSYQSSAIASSIPSYELLPDYPSPLDTRLERRPCRTINLAWPLSGMDIGHCPNYAILSSYEYTYPALGCFPASGNGTNYYVLSGPQTKVWEEDEQYFAYSGTLVSDYNTYGIMDSSGFLTFAPINGSRGKIAVTNAQYTSGALVSIEPNFSSTGQVDVVWRLKGGDAGALLLYGGVYHLGLWCLDIKAMLKEGHKPPFAFNPLNNIRKYRLFAKKTFSKDLLYIKDAYGLPGFNYLFEKEEPMDGSDSNTFIIYQWKIRFL